MKLSLNRKKILLLIAVTILGILLNAAPEILKLHTGISLPVYFLGTVLVTMLCGSFPGMAAPGIDLTREELDPMLEAPAKMDLDDLDAVAGGLSADDAVHPVTVFFKESSWFQSFRIWYDELKNQLSGQ